MRREEEILEEIRALESKINALESKITSVEEILNNLDAWLDSEQGLPAGRRAELLQEKNRRVTELEQLRAKENYLRKKEEDLRARLPAPQQHGAEPPSFFSKEKLGLRKIFSAVAGAANFICMLLEPILCKLNLPRSDFFRHLCRYSGWL